MADREIPVEKGSPEHGETRQRRRDRRTKHVDSNTSRPTDGGGAGSGGRPDHLEKKEQRPF